VAEDARQSVELLRLGALGPGRLLGQLVAPVAGDQRGEGAKMLLAENARIGSERGVEIRPELVLAGFAGGVVDSHPILPPVAVHAARQMLIGLAFTRGHSPDPVAGLCGPVSAQAPNIARPDARPALP